MSDILHSATVKMMAGYYTMLEENWNFILNPKPKYIPKKVWVWMVRSVIKIEVRRVK